MFKIVKTGVKVLVLGVVLGAVVTAVAVNFMGCAPHNRRGYTNVTVVDSTTNASIPTNIVVNLHLPALEDTNVLLADVVNELKDYESSEGQSVNVEVDVINNITNEVDVDVDNHVEINDKKIVVRKCKGRKFPRLYRWLCKKNGKKYKEWDD